MQMGGFKSDSLILFTYTQRKIAQPYPEETDEGDKS